MPNLSDAEAGVFVLLLAVAAGALIGSAESRPGYRFVGACKGALTAAAIILTVFGLYFIAYLVAPP